MANELTHADIDLLMEGLESIEKAAAMSDGMCDMMGALLTRGEDKQEEYLRKREIENAKRKAERRRKQEDVYLLRAKLVQVRRELDGDVAERIISEAKV